MNQHTCGAVFNAYAMVNRLDLAMATWNELAGRGFDIGPFGSSALIKACARARNIGAALQVRAAVGACRNAEYTAVLASSRHSAWLPDVALLCRLHGLLLLIRVHVSAESDHVQKCFDYFGVT
jgi:hypothetical protein